MTKNIKKLFVALDGSDLQDEVLERAIFVAAQKQFALYIGHVIDSVPLEAIQQDKREQVIENLKKDFTESISNLVEKAKASDSIPHVEILMHVGRVRETLLDIFIHDIKPDLVIVGAHGKTYAPGLFLGSAATFLVSNVPGDILVVKQEVPEKDDYSSLFQGL